MSTRPPPPPPPPPYFIQVQSPIGRIEVESDGVTVTRLTIERESALPNDGVDQRPVGVLVDAATQLGEYFAGTRFDFDVPVSLSGTAFQQQIWAQLQLLPWGVVTSYGELGARTGRTSAGRAVGGAVGANPIPIIVPCHRVLASSGTITGYSAGEGIPTKVWLLDHEGIEHRS
ncbi:MAG: methylated-DNA--[protein]-cysteine S-methyltransferase [Microbacteriaceae bacterium]